MEDLTVRRLTKKVFPYIWFRHKLMSSIPSTGIFPFSEMTVFSQTIGNAVIVYLHMYRPTLSYYLEKHCPSMPQSKMQFWIHVAFLCLQVRLVNDNVFDYFLTVCSITAEVAIHCYMDGYDDVLSLASLYFCAFFESELYEGFHRSGGWVGLLRYIKYTSCTELYELVNDYIKKTTFPSEHLPILIMIKHEHLAAQRREKLTTLRLLKIGEIERDNQAKSLVSGIFHWDFMENQRISELRPGILKRMDNVRHKKTKSNVKMGKERNDQSSETNEKLNDNMVSHAEDFISLLDEVHPLEPASTTFETLSNNQDKHALNDIKCIEFRNENKNELNETSEKAKYSSTSSFQEICGFYESLSLPSQTNTNNSKSFTTCYGKREDKKFSENKGTSNKYEIVSKLESYPRFIHYASKNNKTFKSNEKLTSKTQLTENDRTLPKRASFTSKTDRNAGTFTIGTNFTPEILVKSTKSLHINALSELTKSFQELGFNLFLLNSFQNDEKSCGNANFAKIMEKCLHLKNKYSFIQFEILLPKDYFTEKFIYASEKENCDETHSEKQYNVQQLPRITEENFENRIVPHQKFYSEIKKSRFFITKLDDNQFMLRKETQLLQHLPFQRVRKSRYLDSKVEEKDWICRVEASTILKISGTKVDENQMISRNETSLLETVRAIEPIIQSRFEAANIFENHPKNQMILSNKTFENKSKNILSVLGGRLGDEAIKMCRFIFSKVNGNNLVETSNVTKISKVFDNKLDKSTSKDPTSVLRKIWMNDKIEPSKFTADNQMMGSIGKNLFRKHSQTHNTNTSRFSAIKFDGSRKSNLSSGNYSFTELYDELENETIQIQDDGCVRYEKKINFAEFPFISKYQPNSPDKSPKFS